MKIKVTYFISVLVTKFFFKNVIVRKKRLGAGLVLSPKFFTHFFKEKLH